MMEKKIQRTAAWLPSLGMYYYGFSLSYYLGDNNNPRRTRGVHMPAPNDSGVAAMRDGGLNVVRTDTRSPTVQGTKSEQGEE